MTPQHLLLVAIAAFLLWRFARAAGFGRQDVRHALARGARVIDVRTPGEFARGHVAGSRNVPLDQLHGRLAELGSLSDEIVVCCASGARSRRAAGILRANGFSAVLDGGSWAWMRSAVPAATSATGSDASATLSRARRRAEQRRSAKRRRPRKPLK